MKKGTVDYMVQWKDPDVTDAGLLAAVQQAEELVSRVEGHEPLEVFSWPPRGSLPIVSVRCPFHVGERGAPEIAGVWQTPNGPLYRAVLVHPHGDRPQMQNPVHVWHPTTNGVSKVSSQAFKHLQKKGWEKIGPQEYADRESATRRYRPLPATVVRDLFDYRPHEPIHPVLRCKCARHGEGVIDRSELAHMVELARRGSRMQCLAVSFGYTA